MNPLANLWMVIVAPTSIF